MGRILAIGLKGTKVSEGVLLDQISDDDLDIRIGAYWALGRTGTASALSRMAKVIEENPISELVKIAERAILNIDPMYPLAGLREQAVLI